MDSDLDRQHARAPPPPFLPRQASDPLCSGADSRVLFSALFWPAFTLDVLVRPFEAGRGGAWAWREATDVFVFWTLAVGTAFLIAEGGARERSHSSREPRNGAVIARLAVLRTEPFCGPGR
jgi:hypothetical protein